MMHDVGPAEPKLRCSSPPSEDEEASIIPYRNIGKALQNRIGALCYVAFFLVFLVLMSLSAQGDLPVIKIGRIFTHETLILSVEAMQETIVLPITLCSVYQLIIFGNTSFISFCWVILISDPVII